MSQATARRRRIARLLSAAVAFCCRSRSSSCATPAGVWGSPFSTAQALDSRLLLAGRRPRTGARVVEKVSHASAARV